MKPTLEQVLDAADMQGVPKETAEQFFLHYSAQDWIRGNGLQITNWRTLLTLWHRDVHGLTAKAKTNKGFKKPYEKPDRTCAGCGKKGKDFNVVSSQAFCSSECRKKILGW